MVQQSHQADLFRQQLRDCLLRELPFVRVITISKHENVYTCGEQGDSIYFIENGQVKLVMVSPAGKECIVALHTSGDVFGELCLSGFGERIETASAMEDATLKVIPAAKFFALLSSHSLFEGFIRYLSVRIADQQEVITHMVTAGSEHRLATTLLELARKLGKKEHHGTSIEHRISHEELSEMVGTTRPRVSEFMQRFRNLGLIEMRAPHSLVIIDKELSNYLTLLEEC